VADEHLVRRLKVELRSPPSVTGSDSGLCVARGKGSITNEFQGSPYGYP
jgi:hypothetical protein